MSWDGMWKMRSFRGDNIWFVSARVRDGLCLDRKLFSLVHQILEEV